MRIAANPNIIGAMIKVLDTNLFCMRIRFVCEVAYSIDEDDSYIEFKPRKGQQLNPDELVWLGFFAKDELNAVQTHLKPTY
ncbi:hypothetical protein [Sphingobacterium corticibacter]|uniref:Uncharacterized protein n=1 Tax=Sphingobacterium corticibacter TaxID=2171749 RepID=A0A2T8HN96_9SPHI|nr:hypothetical protein [Sphingobacterium corticibacter]PVH26901.1 hypothetical protein DC487_04715 [Sphingobacterium corticibacter]